MDESIGTRWKRAWNAFLGRDQTYTYTDSGMVYTYRPDRTRFTRGNERSIITSVYNRIAIDCAAITIKHVQLDENGRYSSDVDSKFNRCLSLEANLDQTGRAFIQDAVMSLLDEGCIALAPIDTDVNPAKGSFDIETIRTGKIIDWRPTKVKLTVYNERTGRKEDLIANKRTTAIIENPLYAVMNEPNSTAKRLIHKLNLLDAIDEQSGAGKLDLIIQLPYAIKSPTRKQQAEERRKDIETQLNGSKYGIAYTDGTEHITQLNRPVENNLMKQIEYLTNTLYGQLGITTSVMDGTADEKTMLNYYNRTIEPILSAIVDEMKRKFLSEEARRKGQTVMFFRDPFRMVPVNDLAEIADKVTRNAIMSSNEVRQIMGMKPSDDPDADALRNKNLNASDNQIEQEQNKNSNEGGNQNGV